MSPVKRRVAAREVVTAVIRVKVQLNVPRDTEGETLAEERQERWLEDVIPQYLEKHLLEFKPIANVEHIEVVRK